MATMTVIYNSALLPLLIALTTITLATQPVKRDASEGQSNPEGCISDWRGLKKAYLDRQSSADVENSIFTLSPSKVALYHVLVMFYDVGPPPNASTSGRSECCHCGSKDCIIHFIYRFRIFKDIHPELLKNFAFLTDSILKPIRNMANGLTPLCWAPPRFCKDTSAESILTEFSQEFTGTALQGSPWHNDITGSVHGYSDNYRPNPHENTYIIPILLFATVGLCLVLYIHHSRGLVGTVLAHSQVARHSMRSTMLASWILFPWMMAQFYLATKAMADTIEKEKLFRQFYDIYSLQVTLSKAQWDVFLSILLLEAPFLCVFFLHKSTDLHNRKQQLSQTDCRLCHWIRVLGDTLGGIGVVAAVQITSVYLYYCALLLVAFPTFTIVQVTLKTAYGASAVIVIFLLIRAVSSCFRKKCSLVGTVKGVAVLLLSGLCVTINEKLQTHRNDDTPFKNNSSDYAFNAVMRTLMSSVIIGIYGYAVRKMLYQKMKKELGRVGMADQERLPLVMKETATLS